MDLGEWEALEVEAARARLERHQLAGAKRADGRPFILADFLPRHLATDYAPRAMPEEEVMARLRLCGFAYSEKPTTP